ncbi:hypothetical protein V491_08698 [Pseudogymnoascus sp. VKM F-3775]|nr:hypothetical protein V491_08698 [Pseudogymnoascus sp. VKM F-3775]
MKLLEFPSALDDCDQAIKRDPKFIRAYLRKAQAYFGMRDYSKCLDMCEEATAVDEGGANKREIDQQQQKALQAMYATRDGETEEQTKERIQRDPEIMAIMSDPVMNSILQQAQNDPSALQEHMKNPAIRAKITKLTYAGVIRMGRKMLSEHGEDQVANFKPTTRLSITWRRTPAQRSFFGVEPKHWNILRDSAPQTFELTKWPGPDRGVE